MRGFLLVVDSLILDSFFDQLEQLLDGIQPWSILSVEQHIYFHLSSSFHDERVFVDDSIIHQEDYRCIFGLYISSDTSQSLVYEILKQCTVHSTFNDLRRQDFCLTNCSNERN